MFIFVNIVQLLYRTYIYSTFFKFKLSISLRIMLPIHIDNAMQITAPQKCSMLFFFLGRARNSKRTRMTSTNKLESAKFKKAILANAALDFLKYTPVIMYDCICGAILRCSD